MKQNDIKYIIDTSNMIEEQYYRSRGGYDDEQFLNALYPVKVFDKGEYFWKYLTLYQLRP